MQKLNLIKIDTNFFKNALSILHLGNCTLISRSDCSTKFYLISKFS